MGFYLGKLGKGLVDEDEGDEKGEDLLGEAGNETHQEASLKGHHDHHDNYEPEPDPYPSRQVLHSIGRTELPQIYGEDQGFPGFLSLTAYYASRMQREAVYISGALCKVCRLQWLKKFNIFIYKA